MNKRECEELMDKLPRYSELYTLAMVMFYEHFVDVIINKFYSNYYIK